MTVNTTTITSGPYPGNDVADTFDYTFRIELKTQLKVFETDVAGIETELTVDTDYTVDGVGNDAGGTVTRIAGALPSGYTWFIRSNYDQTQVTAFASQGGFFPEVHERAFDKLTFLVQQIQDLIDRTLRLSESYTGVISALPNPESGKYIKWKSDLSGFENAELLPGSIAIGTDIGDVVQLIDDGSGNPVFPSTMLDNLPADSVETNNIVDDQVTYAKIQNVVNDDRILGRVSGADGIIEELTATQVRTLINVEDGANVTPLDPLAKGWINFNGTGTIAIRDSYNVSSIVDNGAGNYTINWDVDFTDADYAVTASSNQYMTVPVGISSSSIAAGSVMIETRDAAFAKADAVYVFAIAMGR